MDSTSLSMATVVIVVGTTEATRLADKKGLAMKPVIGGFLLGIFLFGLGMVNSDLTAKFCYLIIATALLVNGSVFAKALTPKK